MNIETAIKLAKLIEIVAPKAGCHVALTGGCLYKEGERKDVDFIFYRIRQVDEIDRKVLFNLLKNFVGIHMIKDYGFCVKARSVHGDIDMMFPEHDDSRGYPV